MSESIEWISAAEIVRLYGPDGAREATEKGWLGWRGPGTRVEVARRGQPPLVVICAGSQARCIPAVSSAPMVQDGRPDDVALLLPLPVEQLLEQMATGDSSALAGRARELVAKSREKRADMRSRGVRPWDEVQRLVPKDVLGGEVTRRIEDLERVWPSRGGFKVESSPTDAELIEMRRRVDAATSGPWTTESVLGHPEEAVFLVGPEMGGYLAEPVEWRREDGEFVAAARTDMVRLLDEIDRLRRPPSVERPDGR